MARRSARAAAATAAATAAAAEPAEAKAAAPARAPRKKAATEKPAAAAAAAAEEKPRAKRGRPAKAAATAEAKAAEPKAKKPRPAKAAAAAEESKGEEASGAAAAGLMVGEPAPAFCVKNHDEQDVSLADLAGKRVVVYFYPKDDTPGCTAEGKRFTQLHEEFAALNTVVVGVSADKVASHKKFRSKYGFPFTLLADTNRDMIRAYGAVKEGNKIKRSTVLIDEQGRVLKHWSSVRGAAQHPDEVLEFVRSLA